MTESATSIKFRIDKKKKESWKKFCEEKQITLTDLVLDSVQNRIFDNEKRGILEFIEKQDNAFLKIQTNINQVAKIANGQKYISDLELKRFTNQLAEIVKLQNKQNAVFEKIYSMLAK